MNAVRSHLKYATRRLVQRPAFTAVALLSLALGIGANTAMFSLVEAMVLRDPPLADPEELVEVYIQDPEMPFLPFSYPDFLDLREATGEIFTGVAGSGFAFAQLDQPDGLAMLAVELVSANYFSLLGVDPVIGRGFLPEEDIGEDAHAVVVLSHEYWQSAYAGGPGALQQEIRLNGRAFEIVGVAPAEYRGNIRAIAPDLYVPVMMDAALASSGEGRLGGRGSLWFFVKGRRQPGVTMAEVAATLDGLAAHLQETESRHWEGRDGLEAVPTTGVLLNPLVDRVLSSAATVFMIVVGMVLVIACANLASFLLASAADRRKEIAVRIALGATRRHLVTQLLTETTLLALVGGGLGVTVAGWLLRVAATAELPLPIPVTLDLRLDAPVLLFSLGVSVAAGLLFGLVPAFQSTRPDVAPTLKDESVGGRPQRARLRSALVVGQVALSTLLLLASGLFLRSLLATRAIDPGFGREPTAVLTFGLPSTRYSEEGARQFVGNLVEEIERVPGVDAVGMIDNLHLNLANTQTIPVNVDGVEPPEGQRAHSVDFAVIDPGFLDAAGVRLVAGRNFSEIDHTEARRAAIVSETFARRFFPNGDPVGRVVRQENGDLEIVGIASDTKVRVIGEAPLPFVYLAYEQNFSASMTLLATTSTGADATSAELLRIARRLDPELMVRESKTVERHLEAMFFPARAIAMIAIVFGALALVLASIGLFGIVSYTVASRLREVGIRMSLGAAPARVVGQLMKGGLSLVAVGLAGGLLLALAVSRLLSGLLFGIDALDPLVFVGVPAALAGVALLATYLPARRAGRVSPVTALRSQ